MKKLSSVVSHTPLVTGLTDKTPLQLVMMFAVVKFSLTIQDRLYAQQSYADETT